MTNETTHGDAYQRAVRAILDRSAMDRGFIANPFAGEDAARVGLRRTAAVLEELGRPHAHLTIAHVAGSKGKGSTSSFLAAILTAAGHKTGLHTSPHLHSFRERIVVDGAAVTGAEFAAAAESVLAAADAVERHQPELGRLNAFEATFLMALVHFRSVGCDAAVIEVGMGGLLDATNVLIPAVSVITALDLEHTAILGSTIEEIAVQKAGIIKDGVPVVTSPQPPEALAVIRATAERHRAPLLVGGLDFHWEGTARAATFTGSWGRIGPVSLGLVGQHQLENAATALGATACLRQAGLTIPDDALRRGLGSARLAGRFEVVPAPAVSALSPALGSVAPPVILDGAHTPAAAAALVATIQAEYPQRAATIVLGMATDKDVAAFIERIRPVTRRLIGTAAHSARATPSDRIAELAGAAQLAATARPTVAEAVIAALQETPASDIIVITGSLAVVAEAREAFRLDAP